VGVPHAARLMSFTDAVHAGDAARIAAERTALRAEMGVAAAIDAAAVAALFNAIDRVADATGTVVEDEKAAATADLRVAMGIDAFAAGQSA